MDACTFDRLTLQRADRADKDERWARVGDHRVTFRIRCNRKKNDGTWAFETKRDLIVQSIGGVERPHISWDVEMWNRTTVKC
jgi:hypothetical protein